MQSPWGCWGVPEERLGSMLGVQGGCGKGGDSAPRSGPGGLGVQPGPWGSLGTPQPGPGPEDLSKTHLCPDAVTPGQGGLHQTLRLLACVTWTPEAGRGVWVGSRSWGGKGAARGRGSQRCGAREGLGS